MIDELLALQTSANRLRSLVESLDADQLRTPAYPSQWTIAQVLSHIGSGAVIMQRRVDDAVEGTEADDTFAPTVWDAWNARSPEAQSADALAADRALVDRFEALSDDTPEAFTLSMGPLSLDLAGVVRMRLSEHTLHTWDIEVALEPQATLPITGATIVIDNLEMIARFSGKPTGAEHTLYVATAAPQRTFVVELGPDSIVLSPATTRHAADLEMPAEAFIRLVYGRLDPTHTPAIDNPDALDELRRAFPGI